MRPHYTCPTSNLHKSSGANVYNLFQDNCAFSHTNANEALQRILSTFLITKRSIYEVQLRMVRQLHGIDFAPIKVGTF